MAARQPPLAAPPRAAARWEQVAIALAATMVVVVALANSAHKSAWTDEMYSVITASRPLGGTVRRSLQYELQPPLYFSLLNLWLSVGTLWSRLGASIPFARLLSTACAVGCLLTLAAIGRLLKIRGPIPLFVLAALTPGLIWASAEARGYALVLWLTSATLYFFLRLVTNPPARLAPTAVAYAVVAYLALLTSFYAGFVLAGQWIAAAIVGDRRGFRWQTAALAAVAIAFLPIVPAVIKAVANHPTAPTPLGADGHPLRALLRLFLDAPLGGGPLFGRPAILAIALAILAAIPIARWLAHTPADRAERVLAVAAAIPFVVFATLRITNAALVEPRHTLVAAPALLTLWALWLSRTPPSPVRTTAATALVALLVAALYSFERNMLELSDWRGAARIVSASARPDERIFLAPPQEALPFGYYYKGPAPVAGLPTNVRLDVYDVSRSKIDSASQITAQFADQRVGPGVWAVLAWRVEPVGSCGDRILESVLHARFDTVTSTTVHGISVFHARGPAITPRQELTACS